MIIGVDVEGMPTAFGEAVSAGLSSLRKIFVSNCNILHLTGIPFDHSTHVLGSCRAS